MYLKIEKQNSKLSFITKIDIPKIRSFFFLNLTSTKNLSVTFHTKTNCIGGEQGDFLRKRCEFKKNICNFWDQE